MPQVMQGRGINGNRVVVSLCDFSGNWPRPWNTCGGYTVLHYDLKHGDDVIKLTPEQVLADAAIAINDGRAPHVYMVLAAPPCTDFAVSGAQYWGAKDADGRTAASLAVLDACVRLAKELSPLRWALENPVGRLPKLRPELGRPRLYFDPWQYAGWAPEGEVREAQRYTKKTGLWGVFRAPEVDPLPPVRVCKQGSWLQKLGGKSERTKELRSMTPAGFARAFYEAYRH